MTIIINSQCWPLNKRTHSNKCNGNILVLRHLMKSLKQIGTNRNPLKDDWSGLIKLQIELKQQAP